MYYLTEPGGQRIQLGFHTARRNAQLHQVHSDRDPLLPTPLTSTYNAREWGVAPSAKPVLSPTGMPLHADPISVACLLLGETLVLCGTLAAREPRKGSAISVAFIVPSMHGRRRWA